MNTYYVPMEYDIPHAETTRYERKTSDEDESVDRSLLIFRDVEILSMVAVHSSVHGVVFLLSSDALEIVEQ